MLARLFPAICGIALSLVYSSVPEHLFSQASGGSIVGQVRIAPGSEPRSPVLVTLLGRGAVVNTVYTDSEGRFGFNSLPGNLYHIVINDSDYQPFEQDVPVDPTTSSIHVISVFLIPHEAKKPDHVSKVSGGNPSLTDSAQYTNRIPKPARKQFEKGVKSDQEGKTDDAVRYYQKALELAPDFYAARNNLGSDLLGKSDFPGAQQEFEQVIKVNPSDAAAYFNLANLYLLTKRYDQAYEWVRGGLSKQPDSAFGHFLQGSLDEQGARFREAEAAFRRALELDPLMAKAHLALVNLYMQEKRKPEAVTELKSFLKSFPEDPLARKASEVLRKLETGGTNP